MSPQNAPYGSWKSPISSSLLTSAGVSLSQLQITRDGIYWHEGRPLERGRGVVVRQAAHGKAFDVTPPGFNARSRVHEYGGWAYVTHNGRTLFTNFVDQRIYRQDDSSLPVAITPESAIPAGLRYTDARVSLDGQLLFCVRERHQEAGEAINELVVVPVDGASQPRVIASGHDFYSSPRLSPDGQKLAWLTWDHPNMPWDGTDLWVGEIGSNGELANVRRVAGGPKESIVQPEWDREGVLHFISDRTGWWNLYAERNGRAGPVSPMESEVGFPHWIFGESRYAFLSGGRIAFVHSKDGLDHLAIVNKASGVVESVDLPYTSYSDLCSDAEDRLHFIAASSVLAARIVALDVVPRRQSVLKTSMSIELSSEDLSSPEPLEFPTSNGRTAFALFYRPVNKDYRGATGEKPPLLVISHGGPTTATTSSLKLSLQYWTSRGFAVVDVNYGGSTGYGREYRERLNGQWGVVDVEDCVNAARFLAARGDVDSNRMAIRGASAGGYTTLCALVFYDLFRAGASYFGVADLELLLTDTHKFEARYLDHMIGPYPETANVYRQRSPIHFADRLSCPVILFQGLEDKVVPPSQAETMVAALRAKKLPFAYVTFPTEGHGFRQAENIQRAAEAELYFYSRVFGFTPADEIAPVEIENL